MKGSHESILDFRETGNKRKRDTGERALQPNTVLNSKRNVSRFVFVAHPEINSIQNMSNVFTTQCFYSNCRQKWVGLTFPGPAGCRRHDVLLPSCSSSQILRNDGSGASSIGGGRKHAVIIDRFIAGRDWENFDLLDRDHALFRKLSARHLPIDSSPSIDPIEPKFGTAKKTKLLNRLLLNRREKSPVVQCASKDR